MDVTTLEDGQCTRYGAGLNVKLPGLDSMRPDDVKEDNRHRDCRDRNRFCVEKQDDQTWHEPN